MKLVNGRIPAYTVCPFKNKCGLVNKGCRHNGLDHPIPFSCAISRAFNVSTDLVRRYGLDLPEIG